MKLTDYTNRLHEMCNVISFNYKGKCGGIDPISRTQFDVYYDQTLVKSKSVDEAISTSIFDGKSFSEIYEEIEIIDF